MTDRQMEPMALPDRTVSPLERKVQAWSRFRRLMLWMVLVAIAAVVAAIAYLKAQGGPLPIHMLIATIAGVGFTVLIGTGLMGLVFLSAGSGHDQDAADSTKEDR